MDLLRSLFDQFTQKGGYGNDSCQTITSARKQQENSLPESWCGLSLAITSRRTSQPGWQGSCPCSLPSFPAEETTSRSNAGSTGLRK